MENYVYLWLFEHISNKSAISVASLKFALSRKLILNFPICAHFDHIHMRVLHANT